MKVDKVHKQPPKPDFVTLTLTRDEAILLYSFVQFAGYSGLSGGHQETLGMHGITVHNWQHLVDRIFDAFKEQVFGDRHLQQVDKE